MRAWVLSAAAPLEEQPLRLTELPDPEPGPDEVVVDVECCGLCRTDIHVCEAEIPLPVLPVVPGHQVVGRVVQRGANANRFEKGDRVGLAWLHATCQACPDCQRGDENLCKKARFTGYHLNGGFAEKVKVGEAYAYAMPTGDATSLAPLLCVGVLTFRALRQAALARP